MSADTAELIATARRHRKSDLELALAAALEVAEAQRDTLAAAIGEVVHQFHLWSEDANDGTYAYYRSDGLMTAIIAARAALAAVEPPEEQS